MPDAETGRAVDRADLVQEGFTLIETIMALTLAGAILLPLSFWLYHSRASRGALERFRAAQALETELNRALILRLDHDVTREMSGPPYLKLTLQVGRDGEEARIRGLAADRKGRALAELQSAWFGDTR